MPLLQTGSRASTHQLIGRNRLRHRYYCAPGPSITVDRNRVEGRGKENSNGKAPLMRDSQQIRRRQLRQLRVKKLVVQVATQYLVVLSVALYTPLPTHHRHSSHSRSRSRSRVERLNQVKFQRRRPVRSLILRQSRTAALRPRQALQSQALLHRPNRQWDQLTLHHSFHVPRSR